MSGGLLYVGSSIISRAREMPWLKAAGVLYLLLGLVTLGTLIGSTQVPENSALQQID